MPNTDFSGESCECGCRFEEHRGISECLTPGCKCKHFHRVDPQHNHNHLCLICNTNYRCSYSRCTPSPEPNDENLFIPGICHTCAKNITDEYPTGLMQYLFGHRGDDDIDRLLAQKLAMEIKKANLTIKELWDNYWGNELDVKKAG